MKFTFDDKNFLEDGEKYTIISGAMHYFRIPRAYWYDRLLKLKECGFNTVETYTAWNLHEKHEGEFDFTGELDVAEYVKTAKDLGLNVILRPGPYICAEWDLGGLPPWLLSYSGMGIRCNDPLYLSKVKSYYERLFDELRPFLATNGGNIIMVQIENEYGSFGDDKEYLRAVENIYADCGVNVTLFTSDGATFWMLNGGTLPNHLCVANFGSRPDENFKMFESFRKNQPRMCGEYWCGWFDHWYEEHHVRDPKEIADLFRDMIKSGASLNFYMFCGGTNFGFNNGANHFDTFQPTITSYDYNALLTEAGDLTPQYFEVRKAIEDMYGKLPEITASNTKKAAYGKVTLCEMANVLDASPIISKGIKSPMTKYQEDIGQMQGFTLYRTVISGPREENELLASEINDRAVIYIDGVQKGIKERSRRNDTVRIANDFGESKILDIFLENMGHTNYGPKMFDKKGIIGLRLGQQYHFGWEIYPLELTKEQLDKIPFKPYSKTLNKSLFMRGFLTIEGTPCDTFVKLPGLHHGCIFVNGFNLGRYYNDAGPQKTLYCPASVLRTGENEIIVLETDNACENVIEFVDVPELG